MIHHDSEHVLYVAWQAFGIVAVLAAFLSVMCLVQTYVNEIIAPPPPEQWHTRIIQ